MLRDVVISILGFVLPTLGTAVAHAGTHTTLAIHNPRRQRQSESFEQRCLSFNPKDADVNGVPATATLKVLEFVPAGTVLAFPDNDVTCARPSQVVSVDICRVALSVPTSNRSGVVLEAWLPENWQGGRLLGTGNGGIDGCIKYEDLAYGAASGFARTAVGTNNGHNGTSGTAYYQNDDVVTDFAWRALHTSAEVGKQLAASFYGSSPQKSYYIGCSLGGRMGIGSAVRFPEDFDGIVAGSPALDFNALYSFRARFYPLTGALSSPGFITPDTWKTTIHDEVLRQCDGIDGVTDGIIEDPLLCDFRAEELLCGGDEPEGLAQACLTASQVEVVNNVFSNYAFANGTLIYPRMQPGSEILAADGLYAGKPWGPSYEWFRFVLLGDPSWDPATYSLEDAETALTKNPADIETWPDAADLAVFEGRGGKILTFHGLQDQQITSLNSVRYWEHLTTGSTEGRDVGDYFRLFRVPGMNHCTGGPGAWVVGQGSTSVEVQRGIPFTKEQNVLAAVVNWVEKGAAPESILGTKFVNDTVTAGVAYRHRHCRYPLKSTYKGEGNDPLDEGSWECL